MKRVLVTGSSGLIGSEAASYFDFLGYSVLGIDNNMREDLFGSQHDTCRNLRWLKENTKHFRHEDVDIRSRRAIGLLLTREGFDLIIHCSGQPSPKVARRQPLDEFDINGVGTINLLEAARQSCPDAPFITLSSRKVYGNRPGERSITELPTRYDYAHPEDYDGIDESCGIDASTHTIFGASKLAADIMTQEYGRSFNMPTCVFRTSCLIGARQSDAGQGGFLNDLMRVVARSPRDVIVGFKGKQVRDPLHACDVVTAIRAFADAPRPGEVYNLGGGRDNSVSLLECVKRLEAMTDKTISVDYQPIDRIGEHVCYITNLAKFRSHYPNWRVSHRIDDVLRDLLRLEWTPLAAPAGMPKGSFLDTVTRPNSKGVGITVSEGRAPGEESLAATGTPCSYWFG